MAEWNRWLGTQNILKFSAVHRSAQTRQVHTPPNPTCNRWYGHEWLKADYKPNSPTSIFTSVSISSVHLFPSLFLSMPLTLSLSPSPSLHLLVSISPVYIDLSISPLPLSLTLPYLSHTHAHTLNFPCLSPLSVYLPLSFWLFPISLSVSLYLCLPISACLCLSPLSPCLSPSPALCFNLSPAYLVFSLLTRFSILSHKLIHCFVLPRFIISCYLYSAPSFILSYLPHTLSLCLILSLSLHSLLLSLCTSLTLP